MYPRLLPTLSKYYFWVQGPWLIIDEWGPCTWIKHWLSTSFVPVCPCRCTAQHNPGYACQQISYRLLICAMLWSPTVFITTLHSSRLYSVWTHIKLDSFQDWRERRCPLVDNSNWFIHTWHMTVGCFYCLSIILLVRIVLKQKLHFLISRPSPLAKHVTKLHTITQKSIK